MENVIGLILAAGEGKRMNSKKSKLLHEVYDKPIVKRVLENCTKCGITENIVIVGNCADDVKKCLGDEVKYAHQEQRKGTAHAVLQAKEYLKGKKGKVVILSGDVPILRYETLQKLIQKNKDNEEYATILTAIYDNPTGYGRIIRDDSGNVSKIKEHKDTTDEEKLIKEINSGTYCFDIEKLLEALEEITPNNQQNEYYLTDVIELFNKKGLRTGTLILKDNTEILGVNDRVQLASIVEALKTRINTQHMINGVTIVDPTNTYIHDDVVIGKDTVIEPNCVIKSNTVIGEDCQIGPFSSIREGCKIADKAKIGSFVEVKKITLGKGSKIPHLSYVGDADVGEGVNIGCGTITCNYDGVNKHHTTIGNNVFVGSNTNFVAPVVVSDNSIIAAGSTITEDVPKDTLAIARQRQVNKEGYVKK